MQDAFRVSLVLAVLAIIGSFFVRSPKRQPTPMQEQPLTQQEHEEAAAAREEALLAV